MRRYLIILAVVVAAIGGVVALGFTQELSKGLDLQGGLELVYKAQPAPGQEVTGSDLDQAVEIIRDRIDKFGVREPVVTKQGSDQIAVQLAGEFDQARAARLVGKTAQLQFFDLEGDLVAPTIGSGGIVLPVDDLFGLLSPLQAKADTGTPSQWYAFDKDKKLLGGPAPTKAGLADVVTGGVPADAQILAVPQDRTVVTCSSESAVVCPGGQSIGFTPTPGTTYYYLFKFQPNDAEKTIPEMTGDDLERRGTRSDILNGEPVVLMNFTNSGGDKFHEITRQLAKRGQFRANSEGISNDLAFQHFAIVLDNEIRSWPQIDFTELPDGIAGSSAQIQGLDSLDEAKDLALVLQTGSLPVNFVQVDSTQISATLGKQSLREAWIAAVVGLGLVALFLLLFYRFLGLVAIAGLGIYGALLYGAILIFNVTLTLPGFAGLVLTIGVAADANVVIFERIKEEVRNGRSVRAAIGMGYKKGFATIVDANVVTMITAFVLFAVATSGVRGFALMLLIGTIISMITAVAATRALLGVLSGFRWFDNPAFMGASANRIPMWQRVDFIGKRKLWFALSGVVVVVAIVSLGVRGLNLGIDFEGGSQVDITTPAAVSVDDMSREVRSIVGGNPVVQGRGAASGTEFSQFQIRTESLSTDEQANLTSRLSQSFGITDTAGTVSIRNVSGSFSSQILRNALIAIVVSLILIAIYITVRFQWRFAIPVLVALVHDIVITLGIYALAGREVTSSTVAALLTILGYSIYDTIIIFDRVRENMPLMRRSPFGAIANVSLWETIRRSLATTFITLLPVAALLAFGGATLKDFAFALLVGIASGAYSTVFIAAPLLTILKEREPEYRARGTGTMPVENLLDGPDGDVVDAAASASVPARPRRDRRVRAGQPPRPAQAPPAALATEEPPGIVPDAEIEAELGEDFELADDLGAPELSPEAPTIVPADAEARREARRQRRRSRPHGRAR